MMTAVYRPPASHPEDTVAYLEDNEEQRQCGAADPSYH